MVCLDYGLSYMPQGLQAYQNLLWHHWRFVPCRVNFDTQKAAKGEDIPLVKAAKTVFENSNPSFWSLCALVSPVSLIPIIRLLARKFPGKNMQDTQEAFETLYDASDALIEVGLLSCRIYIVEFTAGCCYDSCVQSTHLHV